MMKLYKMALWSFFLFLSLDTKANWITWHSKDNLVIKFQTQDSGVIAIQVATFIPNADRMSLIALLNDTQNASNWLKNVSKVEKINSPNSAEDIVYTELAAPWPVTDRVMLTHSCHKKINESKSKIIIRSVGEAKLNKFIEKDINAILVTPVEGFWLLEDKQNGLHIQHEIYANPQGKIPRWLSNKTALKGVRHTFNNLAHFLLKPQYSKSFKLEMSNCIGFE
ncbi:hypothetical protein CWB73_06345 [Pseudoalteromonas phenolica]|uniref:START domain-containing protein n=1 Tax=Pseudoalteromonas phenolica TaxID=161398 RepID=A0A5S3YWF0_9GAMM|nr:hypothetical protein [Pseudoalteromonas phenolica]TMP82022.1 hypothetical protein CWB73_06345 [Pseudoalteromonas phenolica]